jgi:hypothetical protein
MILQTWKLWQKITTGIVSTFAAIAAVYGAVSWIDGYVLDEAEAGEVLKQQSAIILSESYNRESGDLDLQMELVDLRLEFFYDEAEYRELSRWEENQVLSLEREKTVLGRRLHYIACLQDPTRTDKSTCTQ